MMSCLFLHSLNVLLFLFIRLSYQSMDVKILLKPWKCPSEAAVVLAGLPA